jgi:signal transduction histidine kinase
MALEYLILNFLVLTIQPIIAFFGLLPAILLIWLVVIFYKNKKTLLRNKLLETEIENLKHLAASQEKLATLGTLTAGVVHELKNPLNFVNNFSQLSIELINEWEQLNETEQKSQLETLKLNLQKIEQHGKRADSIIKSILTNSRSEGSDKIPTDINNLCNEFLSIAYHSFRTEFIEFNCSIKKQFDTDIPILHLPKQDFSRVLINIITNALYALKNAENPTLWLTTSQTNDTILITIKDNGKGISENELEHIFTPFYTTKPLGEGTGLGLSLSKEIIAALGGSIKVSSELNAYTSFEISIPKTLQNG